MPLDIYLDNAAATKASAEVCAEVARCLTEAYGNPSSLHEKGVEADRILDEAAGRLAALLHVDRDEIVFTSGGTEANNLAILGTVNSRRRLSNRVLISSIEHPSVYGIAPELERRGFHVVFLEVDRSGVLDLDSFREAVSRGAALVSVMHVNNETGAIQPVEDVAASIAGLRDRPLFHVDAVQALGHVPFHPLEIGADLASFSAHKIHGPKGSGALWVRTGVRLEPAIYGGGQQRSLRSGTENVPGIAGFGVACAEAIAGLEFSRTVLAGIRTALMDRLVAEIPGVTVNGVPDGAGVHRSSPHILNVSFEGVRGEVLVRMLGSAGVCVSTGSACSSRKRDVSRVLKAMNVPQDLAAGSIRLSLGRFNSMDEVEPAVAAISGAIAKLRELGR